MNYTESFIRSDIWKSHDPFTVTQMVANGIPKGEAVKILNKFKRQLAVDKTPTGKVTYRRISEAQKWLRKKWRKMSDQQIGILKESQQW